MTQIESETHPAERVRASLETISISPHTKGVPSVAPGTTLAAIRRMGWSLADLIPPAAVLRESALANNLRVMAGYCAREGVMLAPHGKTTMSPQLMARQVAQGAWGITLSTAVQVRTIADYGFDRLLVAHQVTDLSGLTELVATVRRHPRLRLYLLVDSAESVHLLDEAFEGSPAGSIGVFVEFGVEGGRTGCRTEDESVAVARAAARSRNVELAGLEGYEGLVSGDTVEETITGIDRYLDRMVAAMHRLIEEGLLEGERILSAGGSAYFDRVIDRFRAVDPSVGKLLRSGCYISHDHGKYHRLSPLDGRSEGGPRLQPALEVWAAVVSRPEPHLVVLNAGRRDLSFDSGSPVAVKWLERDSGVVTELTDWWEVVRLMDQHAMLRVPSSAELAVGDLIALGISHPCTTFDKFPLIPVVDDEYRVVDAVATLF